MKIKKRISNVVCLFLASNLLSLSGFAADPFEGADPIWNLLHSPAVLKSMRVTAPNQKKLRSVLDRYDIKFLPYRNQSPDETRAEVQDLWNKMLTELKQDFSSIQWNLLTQIAQKIQAQPADRKQYLGLRIKAPELQESGPWINAEKPLQLSDLHNTVVVLHFYAFGCINCKNNYPVYLGWQETFRDENVAIIGIQTPETKAEHDIDLIRQRAEEAGFTFPILADIEKNNWQAWGNSMWPSVYVLDKQGYIREFWPGELRWEGATGDKYLQQQIEKLMKE